LLTSKISFSKGHKIETGTTKGGRILTATHLDQSNHLANQQQVLGFASLSIVCKNAGPKLFANPNQHVLTFLHPKFAVQCTGGVALSSLAIRLISILYLVSWAIKI
jgi:hypothetical protein